MTLTMRRPSNLWRAVAVRWRRLVYTRRFQNRPKHAVFGSHLLVLGPERIRIGANFTCWRLCTLAACTDGRLEIGDRVSLNANVYIIACSGGKILIGNDVIIGPNVVLRSSDHTFDDLSVPIRQQGHTPGTIVIEDNVWIGANVTVVGGVRIATGSIVAAGAVVVDDVEANSMVGGVPARLIRKREKTGVSVQA
jgi:galactoside O-acetyltransferase